MTMATTDYYELLGVSRDVSESDLKKAYRKLMNEHHPDKLMDLGEEHLQGAKEKFQSIQDAYEKIKNERDL